ncbi:hypothetical protein FDENT_526 [Fusarium denticulatum]|uniref:Uncharacterized protein n=1 Tax=Fusarium denticulatum TaxID=48507 RepID=A0A8H5XKQ2_9HYPO|nr:hypothetical protein FDENT_526 [Fusarium denticulatum]
MFVGLHTACEDLANRVMKKSYKASLRSIGDLWLTLERRSACRKYWLYGHGYPTSGIRETLPSLPFSVGLRRYIPSGSIEYDEYYDDSWWNENPITIPNLSTLLIANLKIEEDVSGKLPKSLSAFKKRFGCLPQELKNLVCSFLHQDQLPLECTYIMPQSMWKQMFFQVPFLWDLYIKEIHDKTSARGLNAQNWDWEKITRQVMSPPEEPRQDTVSGSGGAWGFNKVGLNVPGGFTNRRRIWQILEEMYPNDNYFTTFSAPRILRYFIPLVLFF